MKFLSILVVGFWCLAARAAFVHHTSSEFLTSGDFNGDGSPDVLVLDRLTGNARVGYQTNGVLTWSSPLPTGVPSADALAIGHFRDTNADAVAITSSNLNRINFVRLSNPTNLPVPSILNPRGLGPNFLVGLSAPAGIVSNFDSLTAGSTANADFGQTLLEEFEFQADTLASNIDQLAEQAYLASGNPVTLGELTTYVGAMQRGPSNDVFLTLSASSHFSVVLANSGLPSGTEYAFGTFNQETLPRFFFFVPGQSNLTIQSVLQTNAGFIFDVPVGVSFTQAIEDVFVIQQNGDDTAVVVFGDGVQGLRVPGGSPTLTQKYSSGAGAAGNIFTGVVALDGGNFALLDAPPGSAGATHSQVIHFTGSGFTQVSSANLPALSTRNTRANLWLFQTEPFVTSNPNFISSSNVPDWTSGAAISGTLTVRVETDGGLSTGLGTPATNNFGTPPPGANFALPDQYADAISLFSYAPPRPPESIVLAISPPPGLYGAPISVSITLVSGSAKLFYRVGPQDPYHTAGVFTLTNDATIYYYGSNTTTGARSRLYTANYSFGKAGVTSPQPPLDLAPGTTNPAPPFQTNVLAYSDIGTVFYSRRPAPANVANFLTPSPYLSSANSPFAFISGFNYFYLENFEDGLFNTPGANPSAGWVVANPGSSTDSVDGDDGVIDGSGAAGHSYYSGGSQTNLTITFNSFVLGHLPTHAGIVWTDVGSVTSGTLGHGNVIFSARDASGVLMGTIVTNLGDGTSVSATAEDRFFGVVNSNGISSISIAMTNSRDWEVDHVQYGYLPPPNAYGTIWAINIDGSGETYITTGARPRVSRDGHYLAFQREGDPFNNKGNLWVRDLHTGQETRLLVSNPNPAANTNTIVCYDWDLTQTNLIFDYNNLFWRSDLAGNISQLPLAATFNQGAPSVNPVDGRLAWHALYPGLLGLFLGAADGSSSIHFNLNAISPRWPSWSADGDRIVFADGQVDPIVDDSKNLWVLELSPNETNTWQITGFTDNTNGFPHAAVWSPSGDALVGAGTVFNTNGLWVIPLDGDCMCSLDLPVRLPTRPGDPIDFAGSVVTSAAPAVIIPQPGFLIRRDPDAVVVYWGAILTGFTLETTTDLTPPATWTALPGPYATDGYFFYYSIPLDAMAAQQFFRLHYTGP